jgi:ribosomal protein S27E
MKIRFIPGQPPTFEVEAGSAKQAFERLALIQSLFSETECGCCKSKNIYYTVRKVTDGQFMEMRCLDCRAQLDFGQMRDSDTIWVKKWDKETKSPLPNRGWYIWKRESDANDAQPPATGASQPNQEQPADSHRAPGDVPF